MRTQTLILSVVALMTLAACETVKGVGRDVGTTGEVITDASRQVQKDL
jgi:entericidin B